MEFLPTPAVWIGLVLITAVAGVVRGFSGFGAGLIVAPVYALLVGPRVGLPIMILLEVAASLRLLPEAYRHCRWRVVVPLGGITLVTIPVGVLLLKTTDPTVIQRLIAIVVLGSVVLLGSGWSYRGRLTVPVCLTAGALSGLLTGIGGVGGPPVVILLLASTTAALTSRSDLIAFFSITQTIALVSLLLGGLLDGNVMLSALVLGGVFLLAIEMGSRLFRGAGDQTYRWVALAVLTVVSVVSLAWSFLTG